MNAEKEEIPEDYLRGRNNPLHNVAESEVNGKLASVVEHFGKNWLEKGGNRPIQKLWLRQDGLATDELAILGDSLQRLYIGNDKWVRKIVNTIKTGDHKNRIGKSFELIGLSLFAAKNQSVKGAADNKPGYDGEVTFEGGQTLRLSLKSYGDSAHEQEVMRQARLTEEAFASAMRGLSLNGLGIRILASAFPSAQDWEALRAGFMNWLAACAAAPSQPVVVGNVWKALTYPLPANLSPLSQQYLSYVVMIMVPLHKNEEKNLLDRIEDACTNFAAHPGSSSTDIARAAFIRLRSSASVMKCSQTVKEYFAERPESPLDAVILYQPTVSRDLKTNQSTITHSVAFVGTLGFDAWRAKLAKPIDIRVFVGAVSTQPTQKMISDGTNAWPVDDYYTYQKGDIYRESDLNLKGESRGELGSPAAGILTHAVMEVTPGQFILIGAKLPREEHLELFS